jgi:hypothetical protein
MRIKKTSQYMQGAANLSNAYGTSNENGYTQEYINNNSWKFQMISRAVSLTANTGAFPEINYDSIPGTIICSFLIGVECTTDNGLLTQCVPAELRNNGIMTAISLKSSVNQTCTVRVGVIYK